MLRKSLFSLPIIGAIALAAGTILEKFVLRKRKIDTKLYHVSTFFAIVLVLIPLLFIFWEGIPKEAVLLKNVLIFLFVIVISIFANLFVFYSLKWEKVTNIEPAKILEPIFVVILSVVFSFFFGHCSLIIWTRVIFKSRKNHIC